MSRNAAELTDLVTEFAPTTRIAHSRFPNRVVFQAHNVAGDIQGILRVVVALDRPWVIVTAYYSTGWRRYWDNRLLSDEERQLQVGRPADSDSSKVSLLLQLHDSFTAGQ